MKSMLLKHRRILLIWLPLLVIVRYQVLLLRPTGPAVDHRLLLPIVDAVLTLSANESSPDVRVPVHNHTFAEQKEECTPPRKDQWTLTRASEETDEGPKKKVLIAQYSAYGSYSKLLELTAPITKAYGKRWNHDVLIVQGVAFGKNHRQYRNSTDDDEECEENSNRAMYNKLSILLRAVYNQYDLVLLLDADALIYDLEFDIPRLLSSPSIMLVAHGAGNSDSDKNMTNINTWNVNNGVTLWNLKHNAFNYTLHQWAHYIHHDLDRGILTHGDQSYLHRVLKRHGLQKYVLAMNSTAFQYRKGSIVKHFTRRNQHVWTDFRMDDRIREIETVVHQVCMNHLPDCRALDHIPYSTL